jgi:hypothetical protein
MIPRNYDPREYDWGWVLATGAVVLFVFLMLANYSGTTNTETNTSPTVTSNAAPRIPASTTGSGARPEQPTPVIHGGPSR